RVRRPPGGVRGHPRELRARTHRSLPRDGASGSVRRRLRSGAVRGADDGPGRARDPHVARLFRGGHRAVVSLPRRGDAVGRDAGLSAMDLLMRSKLFVPASRPELFAKALAGDADAISFDLEDAVQDSRKVEARQTLRAFLEKTSARPGGKLIIVR